MKVGMAPILLGYNGREIWLKTALPNAVHIITDIRR